MKLGSGIADIPKYLKNGISVSLGADGAPCNNNLNIFNEMKLAAFIQKPIYGPEVMSAETIFYLANIEGAKALHLDNITGSIEEGKAADLVLIDLDTIHNSLSQNEVDVYSKIVYSASAHDIKYVFVDGEMVVQNGESKFYDNEELLQKGREELSHLIKRVN